MEDYTIYAVKTVPPWEEESKYWTPLILNELKNGRARFGWAYKDELDAVLIKGKLENVGWNGLTEDEKGCWSHCAFLLEVKANDFFVYINMPTYGKCSAVKIKGGYEFFAGWDKEKSMISDIRSRVIL